MSLLGIDIGSGSCKGAVFDACGNMLAQAIHGYSSCNPAPGKMEMFADVFWDAVVNVIRRMSGICAGDPIEALSISTHGETIIPVDKDGNAISPAIMNSDNRAVAQADRWEETFGKHRTYGITGLPLHAMFPLLKIQWLRENEPVVYSTAKRFVGVEEYILMKMGLPPYTDYSLASRMMAFDIRNLSWSDDILSHAGIDHNRFGIPLPAGEMIGRLSREVAQPLGLMEGTIVALGGHDQPCGALGSGVVKHGDVSDSAGTYECLTAVTEKPANTDKALVYSLNSYCHVVPRKYVTLSFFPAGLVSRWFVEQFCHEERHLSAEIHTEIYELLDKGAEEYCKGPTGIIMTPHFIGSCNPYWDVRATGAIVGLTPDITKYHLFKAIYEGLACELSVNVNALEEITGPIDRIRIFGGNSLSQYAVQLRADLTGKVIQKINASDAVCQGAAILAGVAAGVYTNCEEAASSIARVGKTLRPDSSVKKSYETQMRKYRKLYLCLESIRESG